MSTPLSEIRSILWEIRRQLRVAKEWAWPKVKWPKPVMTAHIGIYHQGRKECLEELESKFPRWAEPKKKKTRGVKAIFWDIDLICEEFRDLADELDLAANRTKKPVLYKDFSEMLRMRSEDTREELEEFDIDY